MFYITELFQGQQWLQHQAGDGRGLWVVFAAADVRRGLRMCDAGDDAGGSLSRYDDDDHDDDDSS